MDREEGNCFACHKPGHQKQNCPAKENANSKGRWRVTLYRVGAVNLCVRVEGEYLQLRLENVFYSPGHQNLLSQSEAHGQGYDVEYDNAKRCYSILRKDSVVLKVGMHRTGLWIFAAQNNFLTGKSDDTGPSSLVNFALSDGVADLQCWHDRLGHLCPQYIMKMADEGLVKGMTLRKRQFDMCEACQLGKQRAKTPAKHLDRNVKKRNQLVFADLLFPPSNYNCTRFSAVLVIMDAHTRFMTIYPVKTKFSKEINPLMRRYIAWVERQWPQDPVKEVFTDGGGEFDNAEMTTWYQRHGIMFTTTPSHTSRLNMVERSHQTLTGMLKSMMKESGLPTSFWVDALHYAVYIKNRTYSDAINGIPYEAISEH
ncbi:Putative retroelement [Phytophthora palmivora]|uniref:Retroelement n=1 Tax=Phytophthora palmivora TaxID=4796 RepID=A0A2P4XR30_9STRA|nr:Putative retroelement [Phytophthora palmivora]